VCAKYCESDVYKAGLRLLRELDDTGATADVEADNLDHIECGSNDLALLGDEACFPIGGKHCVENTRGEAASETEEEEIVDNEAMYHSCVRDCGRKHAEKVVFRMQSARAIEDVLMNSLCYDYRM